MHRFATFVDGSNLFVTLKLLDVTILSYEQFYRFIFEHAVAEWRHGFAGGVAPPSQLHRVYWYVVGEMDDWDLSNPYAARSLRAAFDADEDTRGWYAARAGNEPDADPARLAEQAWDMCLADAADWYGHKCDALDKMRRFYHSVRTNSNFIDIIECGRWKANMVRRYVDEKGLDTTLAVDMVALQNTFDVALLISGDADTIPSINYIKTSGKHVATVDFVKGDPNDRRGGQFSSRLKIASDFVVQIRAAELVAAGVAKWSVGPAGR